MEIRVVENLGVRCLEVLGGGWAGFKGAFVPHPRCGVVRF